MRINHHRHHRRLHLHLQSPRAFRLSLPAVVVFALSLLAAACDDGNAKGKSDARSGDAKGVNGSADSRNAADLGNGGARDLGTPDANTPDEGREDVGIEEASVPDATAADALAGDAGCSVGEATSLATPGQLNLFGTPAYFNNGDPLPAGRYRIRYVDGCMKYGGGQGWTVNAYAEARSCWYVIGETTTDRVVVPPGAIGYAVGSGGFTNFEDCVTASRAASPVEFETTVTQRLGIWLLDSPYSDNVAGQDGRNPRWALEALGGCVAQ